MSEGQNGHTVWPEEGDVVYVVCEYVWAFNSPKPLQRDFMIDHGKVQNVIPKYSNPKQKYEVQIDGHYCGLHYEKPGHERMFYTSWEAVHQAKRNAQKEKAWKQKIHSDDASDVLLPPGTFDRIKRWKTLGLKRRTGYLPLNFKVMAKESEERIRKETEKLNEND